MPLQGEVEQECLARALGMGTPKARHLITKHGDQVRCDREPLRALGSPEALPTLPDWGTQEESSSAFPRVGR